MDNPVLVTVQRGQRIESRHRGSVAVIDADGGVIASLGDIDAPVFPRSAIKAFQALPLIESGAADAYGLTAQEIALACASHSGEERHVATATAMLAKAGLEQTALECGTHWPMSERVGRTLAAEHRTPTPLHNNCSGKHAGFLCVACVTGVASQGYVGAAHPVQETVRDCLESLTGERHDDANRATDGCSIPTYAVPLRSLALGFARLATGVSLAPLRRQAAIRILASIAAAPEMIAGERKFDTEIIALFEGQAIVKVGAEGVYCGAVPASGLGIAIKADDGSVRSAEIMMAAILDSLLEKTDAQAARFEPIVRPILRNWNGIEVGSIRSSAELGPSR